MFRRGDRDVPALPGAAIAPTRAPIAPRRAARGAVSRGASPALAAAMSNHVVTWIDHHEARLFTFEGDGLHTHVVVSHAHPAGHGHRHHETRHAEADERFLSEVTAALAGADPILIVGPSTAKLELMRHLHRRAPETEAHVVGVETADHPTDGQVVAFARRYFRASDRMR